jgi:predicted 2-oxoglutarate/Fe(II)-dependent dioxygenase YbiX/peroxiredoxin
MSYAAEPPPPHPDGYRRLFAGDPAPWFEQASSSDPRFQFDLAAGRYVVLCFFVSAADPAGGRALSFVANNRGLFDDDKIAFFGVSINWRDQQENRVQESLPGVRFFWDFDLKISRRYGAVPVNAAPGLIQARRLWCIMDPTLRIMAVVRFEKDGSDRATVLDLLQRLPPVDRFAGIDVAPPVLFLPNVFEETFCRRLVAAFDGQEGRETGTMVQVEGRTVEVHDPLHRRRSDHIVTDAALIADIRGRLQRPIVPELSKACQFDATKMERYLIGCYRADQGGHFGSHRDNTTTATAHRRFALSVNLNEDYEGGEIGFPEYGSRRYKPPTGGALVFSCSLLHAVSPVTRGRRYAFLPFLHDDAAERALLDKNAAVTQTPA